MRDAAAGSTLRWKAREGGPRTREGTVMGGFGEMIDKAKEMVGGDAAVDGAIDQAADAAKEHTPDVADGAVDAAAEAAKGAI